MPRHWPAAGIEPDDAATPCKAGAILRWCRKHVTARRILDWAPFTALLILVVKGAAASLTPGVA